MLKDLFKNIKDSIIVNEEVAGTTPATPSNTTPVQPVVEYQPQSYSPGTLVMGAIDNKMREHFAQLFNESNLPGNDIYEFIKALEAQASIPVAENVKYQMVYATLSQGGLTMEKLISSADHYQEVFDNEKRTFDNDVQARIDQEVGTRNKRIEELNTLIAEQSEQLKALSQKILDEQSEIGVLQNESVQKNQEISQKQKNFELTLHTVKQELNDVVQKIKSFIPQPIS